MRRAVAIEIRAAELASGSRRFSRGETRGRNAYFGDRDPGLSNEAQAGWLSAHIETDSNEEAAS